MVITDFAGQMNRRSLNRATRCKNLTGVVAVAAAERQRVLTRAPSWALRESVGGGG